MNLQSIRIHLHNRVGGILGCLNHTFNIEVVDPMMFMVTASVVMAIKVGHHMLVLFKQIDERSGIPRPDW
eukprot:SAG22_NODE_20762_length_263_cov_0.585366_1_plen_69_part_01